MRGWVSAFALALIAASCAERSEEAADAPACAASRLPITGVCADGHPSRFRTVSADFPLYVPECVWRTEEARIGPDAVLVFRAQDCTAVESFSPIDYVGGDGVVGYAPVEGAEGAPLPFLRVFPDLGGVRETLEPRIAELGADERARCAITPYETPFAEEAWRLAPDPAYKKELEARGEPYEACGPLGIGPWESYWEFRSGQAWYWDLGQDQPPFDPVSFTLYRPPASSGSSWAPVED